MGSFFSVVQNPSQKTELENVQLKTRVKQLEQELSRLKGTSQGTSLPVLNKDQTLSLPEYLRYGRQLILPDFGLSGQVKLKNSSILIVGAGGLGAPASIYLAAAGVGRLGIIDYDVVETSNLQRQIIHNESRSGVSKAQSAKMTIEGSNALQIIKQYDIVIDATDNVATRYLLNDACVLTAKPLVSGSALRMDGQLTVYNYCGGPCYRCLYPEPPPPETVTNCTDGGILGPVTGVIGCLQALEALKIVANFDENKTPHLLLFTANSYPPFRSIKLRPRKATCSVCGDNPTILELQDYVQLCGSSAIDKSPAVKLLEFNERVDPKSYQDIRTQGIPHVLVDVREPAQFGICNLAGSINIPLKELQTRINEVQDALPSPSSSGNDSQYAVQLLREVMKGEVKDVVGGLRRWSEEVDNNFPIY